MPYIVNFREIDDVLSISLDRLGVQFDAIRGRSQESGVRSQELGNSAAPVGWRLLIPKSDPKKNE